MNITQTRISRLNFPFLINKTIAQAIFRSRRGSNRNDPRE
jgi:hypothetical protein